MDHMLSWPKGFYVPPSTYQQFLWNHPTPQSNTFMLHESWKFLQKKCSKVDNAFSGPILGGASLPSKYTGSIPALFLHKSLSHTYLTSYLFWLVGKWVLSFKKFTKKGKQSMCNPGILSKHWLYSTVRRESRYRKNLGLNPSAASSSLYGPRTTVSLYGSPFPLSLKK